MHVMIVDKKQIVFIAKKVKDDVHVSVGKCFVKYSTTWIRFCVSYNFTFFQTFL